jgi:hypothetical protein
MLPKKSMFLNKAVNKALKDIARVMKQIEEEKYN